MTINETEQIILGSILIDPVYSINEVISTIDEDDFESSVNKLIFKTMIYMHDAKIPVDFSTLYKELSKDEVGKKIDISYIAELSSGVATAGNIKYHAEVLKDNSNKVKLKSLCNEVIHEINNGEDTQVLLNKIESDIFSMSQVDSADFTIDIKTALSDKINLIEYKKNNKDQVYDTLTNFRNIDEIIHGFKGGNLVILAARPSIGKEQGLHNKILTPTGFTNFKDIEVGEDIIGTDGKTYQVTGVFPQGEKDLYTVSFDDGSSTECGLDHLWLTKSRKERKNFKEASVKTLSQIIESGLYTKDNRKNHSIDFMRPAIFENKELPLDPYVLGIFIGDGSFSSMVKIHNVEDDILLKIDKLLPVGDKLSIKRTHCNHSIIRKKFNGKPSDTNNILTDLGYKGKKSYDKFIPKLYLFSSIEQRISLLKGLIDSDGNIVSKGQSYIEYSTTSEQLMYDIKFLVMSLGGRISIKSRIGSYKKYGKAIKTRLNYRIYITMPKEITPCSSIKHLLKYHNKKKWHKRYITEIKKYGKYEAKCIMVNSPNNCYITDDFIVTHNSTLMLNVCSNICLFQNKKILLFSLEMSKDQLMNKLLASQMKINSKLIEKGHLKKEDWQKLFMATKKYTENNGFFINDKPGITYRDIQVIAKRMKASQGLDFIAIDYLQLLNIPRGVKVNSKNESVGLITKKLKELARELDIPIMVLSQLSRKVEERNDKRPMLSDLRDSGEIEQDADIVAMLFREAYYDKSDNKIAECIIAKNREGATGTARLVFMPQYSLFYDNIQGDF